jgi:hypothetical protein
LQPDLITQKLLPHLLYHLRNLVNGRRTFLPGVIGIAFFCVIEDDTHLQLLAFDEIGSLKAVLFQYGDNDCILEENAAVFLHLAINEVAGEEAAFFPLGRSDSVYEVKVERALIFSKLETSWMG